jgi:hypothetical protein
VQAEQDPTRLVRVMPVTGNHFGIYRIWSLAQLEVSRRYTKRQEKVQYRITDHSPETFGYQTLELATEMEVQSIESNEFFKDVQFNGVPGRQCRRSISGESVVVVVVVVVVIIRVIVPNRFTMFSRLRVYVLPSSLLSFQY